MSWMIYDPDATVPVSEHRTCLFHQNNPGKFTPFCSCSSSYGSRPATPEEYRERRRKRLSERAEELRSELAGIEAAYARSEEAP